MVRDFVASYGSLAMFVSFLLMILTVVFPPLPAFMVTFANANLLAGGRVHFCLGAVPWQVRPFALSGQIVWKGFVESSPPKER